MPQRRAHRLIIAIDTGGTFTDCAFHVGSRLEILKIPSTPRDPGAAILDAVRQIVERVNARFRKNGVDIRHGTTVATNALLERKGAKVAFVTTEGFEDTLAIARQARPSLYDWNVHRPLPLADGECCFGLSERVGSDGRVLRSPSKAALDELRRKVKASGAESIAVSLLFSFAHPAHERDVQGALASLNLPLSLSHQILPEFREYERAATVTLNAYLAPRMQSYIRDLERSLAALKARLSVMQSSGGILSALAATREPVRTILSGPAGGLIGALSVARTARIRSFLSFDMGGTSTDVAVIDSTVEPATSVEGEVAGHPVRVPMLDIHTAGAGGGSLAWIDRAGALQVGPQSAGADPGPACYGRGDAATVTDANLVLGRLHPEHFLGGAMHLDKERAEHALAAFCAPGRGFATVQEAAQGIVRVANVRMESALRHVSVERGHDPRDFALIAFGGAGPLHACSLATALGIRKVLVPAAPGALSALGILHADLSREFSRTVMLLEGSNRIARIYRELEAEARATFRTEGLRPSLTRSADMRYQGQGFELRVAWGTDAVAGFHQLHAQAYGYADPHRSVEIVTLRVQAVVRNAHRRHAPAALLTRDAAEAIISSHRVFEEGGWRRAVLYDRDRLKPGSRMTGPAVITELSATTYLPSHWTAAVDGLRNLVLEPPCKARTGVRK
jgi:N-methylhydantoinase A